MPTGAAAPFLTGLVAVVALSFADGGYRPSEWGLATICFVLLAVSVLVVADPPRPRRLERTFLAALAAFTLWAALSALWSPGAAAAVLEAERSIVYVSAAAAALLVLSARRSPIALTSGVLAGVEIVALYGLATRLFPDRLGDGDGNQLAAPVGYSNALALLATIGIVLSLGHAAHGRTALVRSHAAAAAVLLAPTLYLTFSRGALVALAAGLLLQAALDPRRARLLTSMLVVGAPAALGVLLASRSQAGGWRLTAALAALAAVAAACAPLTRVAERHIQLRRRAVQAVATVLAVGGLAAATAVIAVAGGPVTLARRGADAFADTQPTPPGDEGERVLNVSGSGRADYWGVAWDMAADNPLLGAGGGSFEAHWLRDRPASYPFDVRDAHNLYLETLAEVGPVGLGLLAVALAVPLVGLARSRRRRLAAAAGGAYVAFLVHAAVDWDWEIPAVTVAALLCGTALLAWSRVHVPAQQLTGRRRRAALALALPVGAVALVAHVGNRAIAASEAALLRGDAALAAAEARRAEPWMPWSHEPWQRRGEAELALGNDRAARASLRRALELDPENWRSWYDLAVASRGAERERALARVKILNPLAPEADELEEE